MNIQVLHRIVSESVNELIERDKHLFDVGANERSLTHKLACYISKRIPERSQGGWDVDAEYNRNRDALKTLKCLEFSQITNYPDIIVHRRDLNNDTGIEDNNLLIIEVKSKTKFSLELKDYKKIKCLIESNPYHYKYGLYINLNNGISPEFTYFERVKSDGDFVCKKIIEPVFAMNQEEYENLMVEG